jgi:serine phosphatase RsbU (regulator of sigma subunit)
VKLRKSTRIYGAIFVVAIVLVAIDGSSDRLGAVGSLAVLAAWTAGLLLAWRAGRAAWTIAAHRLALRLAFSYFLIGIVPIPLLAALFAVVGYFLSHQYMATRLRSEVDQLAELSRAESAAVPRAVVGPDDRVISSDVTWLAPGDDASWAKDLVDPHPIVGDDRVWMALRTDGARGSEVRFLPIADHAKPYLQRLADRTGYSVAIELGSEQKSGTGYEIRVKRDREKNPDPDFEARFVAPRHPLEVPKGVWGSNFLAGVYVDRAVAVIGKKETATPVVAFVARTSPAVVVRQIFAQGVPEMQRVVRIIFLALAGALLCVYLVALAIAFVLVASIVRNVNRLTRATAAVARGDFSVRVNSRSRDQIGDLARSFDGMAGSIERLLRDTARKEKLEAELAVARAIEESFLPASGASWKGFQATAHFEPVADLGGDYYDILPMPDGRTAISIGDVSGHGLPTGLLAAAARATLASFVELGVPAPEAFVRLGRRVARARDPHRHLYTTLCFFAYDAPKRAATLTNAGHPAPYRVGSGGRLERLPLPAMPIGLLPERNIAYPSQEFRFEAGDKIVFFTDGVVEAANGQEEPWGYERFEALLSREWARSAPEIIQRVLDEVSAHVGSTPLEDDRTLLVLTLDAADRVGPGTVS